ncbi:MAG: zinc-ribbon domain-containing protein, partial [Myxococcota bacterium]
LIVTCTRCATQFKLDDARLPLKGARVRCSRCKQAFFLAHPQADRSDAVHAAAREALEQRVPRAPEPARDPEHETVEAPVESVERVSRGSLPVEAQRGWKFDFDPRDPTISSDSLPSGTEPSLFAFVDDITVGLEHEGDAESGVTAADSAELEVSAHEELRGEPARQRKAVPLGRFVPSPATRPLPASGPGPALAQNGFDPERARPESTARALPRQDSMAAESSRGRLPAPWRTTLFGFGHLLGWGATLGLLLMGLASGL